jgi:hypothetical protein
MVRHCSHASRDPRPLRLRTITAPVAVLLLAVLVCLLSSSHVQAQQVSNNGEQRASACSVPRVIAVFRGAPLPLRTPAAGLSCRRVLTTWGFDGVAVVYVLQGAENIFKQIFNSNYDPSLRPNFNTSQPVSVRACTRASRHGQRCSKMPWPCGLWRCSAQC